MNCQKLLGKYSNYSIRRGTMHFGCDTQTEEHLFLITG